MPQQTELNRDLKMLAQFIRVYCRHKHTEDVKSIVRLPTLDLESIVGGYTVLCPGCAKLLAHAFYKRTNCPLQPKPACKHCPNHCYHPSYRAQIRQVMKFSGQRMLLSGRLDFLFHLLF